MRADSENHRMNKKKMAERQRECGGWTRIGGVLISVREAIWSRLKAPKPLQVKDISDYIKEMLVHVPILNGNHCTDVSQSEGDI